MEKINNVNIPSWEELRFLFAETRQMIRESSMETDKKIAENEKRFAETRQMIRESSMETDKKIAENEKRFAETRQMIRESSMETEKMFQESKKESNEQFAELRQVIKQASMNTEKMFQETDKKFEKSREDLNKLQRFVGGIGQNNGELAEEFFYSALSKRFELKGINYNYAMRNLERRTKKLEGEYDIVLVNDKVLTVIEVKYKLHPEDVVRFKEKKFAKFRLLFPEYDSFGIYGCIAGLVIPSESLQLAEDYGFMVLGQNSDNIEIKNKDDFKPTVF